MKCPLCGNKTKIKLNTLSVNNEPIRIRVCPYCDQQIITIEIPSDEYVTMTSKLSTIKKIIDLPNTQIQEDTIKYKMIKDFIEGK